MNAKAASRNEVGAPPPGLAPLGRLNCQGDSVLYLADSPATAFAESRAAPGHYCLSEWVTTAERIALANGGFDSSELNSFFGAPIPSDGAPIGGEEDREVEALYREIFSLDATDDPKLYWWSIACGRVNRFAAKCGRTGSRMVHGNTVLEGEFPLAGIAYLSVQKERQSLNCCLNDLGMTYVELVNVQWVSLGSDGKYASLDIATSWEADGSLNWSGRPANLILGPGQTAQLRRMSETVWEYRTVDGALPRVS